VNLTGNWTTAANCTVSEPVTVASIAKTMSEFRQKFPPSTTAMRIMASYEVMAAVQHHVHEAMPDCSDFAIAGSRWSFGYFRGLPIEFQPHIPPKEFLTIMGNGDGVMTYDTGFKVRCLTGWEQRK
jgi:hypothetical protein